MVVFEKYENGKLFLTVSTHRASIGTHVMYTLNARERGTTLQNRGDSLFI